MKVQNYNQVFIGLSSIFWVFILISLNIFHWQQDETQNVSTVEAFHVDLKSSRQYDSKRIQQQQRQQQLPSKWIRSSTTSLQSPSSSYDNAFKTSISMSTSSSPDINSAPMSHKKKNLKTFQRFLEIECWRNSEFRELESVLKGVAESCKQINRIVQRAQTDDLYGAAVDVTMPSDSVITNVQGEVQQQLDVLCNTYMLRAFCGSGSCIQMVASEEEDVPRCCSDVMTDSAFAVGDYIAVFDPIDGSKNIDASLPVGSIFGVYKKPPGAASVDDSTFLQDGRSLVAAGYCLFSATTVLVLTLGNGVEGFTLDPDSGRFLHTLKDLRIPKRGNIYSFNEANWRGFEEPVQRYLHMLKQGVSSAALSSSPSGGKNTSSGGSGDGTDSSQGPSMTARYIGALVADVHNILINGGI
jgi:fructose-1,6-bisphosphatase I